MMNLQSNHWVFPGLFFPGFCDKSTGLTCTGRPEEPLQSLMAQGVTTVILHTGEDAAVSMCQKLQQTDPKLIHEKVSPSETAKKVVSVLESKVRNGQN